MRWLIIPFMFTGIELSFWSGIYPTCISFTKKLGPNTNTLLAFNAMAQGAGQVISGLFFGLLNSNSRKLNRETIVLLGATIHLLVFVAVFINFPQKAPLEKTFDQGIIYPNIEIALVCGFFLAFADACWNTQIFSFLITHFPNQGSQAFALNLFFENLMTSAAFFYGTSLQLEFHLIILSVGAVIGCISFFLAERVKDNVEKNIEKVPQI